jgi:hypothetical protein
LKLDCGADLLDREACRDGHTKLARRDQASSLFDGAGAALAPFAGVIPSTCAAMVVMRSSGTPSSRAACAASVP